MPPAKRAALPIFEVRNSPIHGRGVFARRRIPVGTRIVEYTGEPISHAEADERYQDDDTQPPHVLVFILDKDTVIDAARGGSQARYINHSCAPNCEAVVDDDHIFVEAIRDIPRGAELTYDYNLERPGRRTQAWDKRYACNCGAKTCRGTMLKPPRKRAKRNRKRAASKKP